MVLFCLFAFAQKAEAIVGGGEASPRAFPFVVALVDPALDDAKDGQFCAGTLVAAQWVLTAASCLYLDLGATEPRALLPTEIDIYAGSDNFTGGDRIHADKLVLHPSFDLLRGVDDIALVHLERPPRSGLDIQSVTFATDPDLLQIPHDRPATVVGWGATETEHAPKSLRFVGLALPSITYCAQLDERFFGARWADIQKSVLAQLHLSGDLQEKIRQQVQTGHDTLQRPHLLCTGLESNSGPSSRSPWLPDPGPCTTDAGGPLLSMWPDGHPPLQLGIISFPYGDKQGCSDDAFRHAYVNVGAYAAWITSVISTP
jgi:secreted trypsin-like serine protease